MPIPPRPIPQRQARPLPLSSGTPPTRPGSATQSRPHSQHTRHSRPGFAVPQKAPTASLDALTASGNQLEWRAEVALLDGLPRFQGGGGRLVGSAPAATATPAPRSIERTGGLVVDHGVMMITASERAREQLQVRESESRREGREVRVDLEGLIEQGRGKREKRVTTATSLGFDFIAKPNATSTAQDLNAAAPLPDTPGLDPSSSSPPSSSPLHAPLDQDEEEGEGDWEMEWEHVALPLSTASARTRQMASGSVSKGRKQVQIRQGDEDEDDMIILGEMELDEPEPQAADHAHWSGVCGGKGARGQLTYAAAVGRLQ